ncbi:MAG: carbohydrate ABC transporter permease [Clostridiales bacterium]|nr:carbohydrate ABC transporter permease [Clostridiales bacterium]
MGKDQVKILLLILPLVIFMALPIVYIINHAFKPMDELFAFPPTFFVRRPTLDNFTNLIKVSRNSGIPLSRYIFNSFVITLVTIGLSLVFTTLAAFSLSKLKYRGRNMLMQINQIAIMFVATAVSIPRYLIIAKLGLVDSYLAHILPLLSVPVALFLVKQFVDQVPQVLIEAAYIDGASDFHIYRKLIIPMIKPAIATAAILVFQQVWTNMETSNFYINDDSMKSLTFYMNSLTNANNTVAGQGIAAAATLIMFIPNLVLFILLQKNVMNTMAHSGIK